MGGGCVGEGYGEASMRVRTDIAPSTGKFEVVSDFEPSGAVHTTNGSATDGPTRAVVFILVPKGMPLTAPA